MSGSACPAVTAEQMREVDRAMVEDFHIELGQMMENAGRSLAELAVNTFDPVRVVVLAGPGGNGGGGLVAARHLANRGRDVHVVLAKPADHLGEVPAHQLDILARIGVPIGTAPDPPLRAAEVRGEGLGEGDLIVDTLIGYSLVGSPAEPVAGLVRWANGHAAPVLSLDTPSGLDVTTGVAANPCVRAAATLTLALPKVGLLGSPEVGRLYLADISVPPLVYERMGIEIGNPFGEHPIVSLDCGGPAS
ncbi:NAD(P)H-hydrate epimerase [Saccharomonospora amisosensis]|uniref:NAD(P)H-hydrate epimerase n=1 Tax=Saccharomonospora amisosensis TaxID=1128677 RepID=A0A7X5UPM7_9PSEU|nr:NAD(P)H-hydrate epimerase [Saccharomonospora amisosensis]NIJ11913.1 NAD(P)H-hydrate epimerase [Saccharomonospora amisosensis]